jgi:hypothetical protein
MEESNGGGDDRHALQHNWVDEIARSDGRPGVGGGNDVNINTTTIRLRPARNSSALTRQGIFSWYLPSMNFLLKMYAVARHASSCTMVFC